MASPPTLAMMAVRARILLVASARRSEDTEGPGMEPREKSWSWRAAERMVAGRAERDSMASLLAVAMKRMAAMEAMETVMARFWPIRMVLAGGCGKSDTARAMGRSPQSVERVEGAGRGDPTEIQIFSTSDGVFFV